jgi:hypothetical protein
MADIKNLPSFNMRKDGIQVEVMEWIGDLDHFGSLTEVWVQLEGIPPNGVTGLCLPKWLQTLVY